MLKKFKFIFSTLKLKDAKRTGWYEVGISKDRIESVADHIVGCFNIAFYDRCNSDRKLNWDKVNTMIYLKELKKISQVEEFNPSSNKQNVFRYSELFKDFKNKDELYALLDEIEENLTEEAKYVNQLGKIESDFQAKDYDRNGYFDRNKALEDAENYGERKEEIIPQIDNASDGWILYDRKYYTDPEFKEMSEEIQKYR